MTYGQILEETDNLSLEEMRKLNSSLVDKMKRKSKRNAKETLEKLEVGQIVTVDHEDAEGEFEVIKINRTRAVLKPAHDPFRSVTVPAELIQI